MLRRSVLTSTAVLLFSRASSVCLDQASLLQVAHSVQHRAEVTQPAADGACGCLSWNDVYNQSLAQCGQGLETYTYGRQVGQGASSGHWCDGVALYPRRSDNFCTKVLQASPLPHEPEHFQDGTWCYVSAACAELHGGAPVNTMVSWKACQSTDGRLADLQPQALISLAAARGVDIGLLTQMSYGVLQNQTAMDVHAEWLTMSQGRWAYVRAGEPMIVCEVLPANDGTSAVDPCGHGETFVVTADAVWRMDNSICRLGDAGCPQFPASP